MFMFMESFLLKADKFGCSHVRLLLFAEPWGREAASEDETSEASFAWEGEAHLLCERETYTGNFEKNG